MRKRSGLLYRGIEMARAKHAIVHITIRLKRKNQSAYYNNHHTQYYSIYFSRPELPPPSITRTSTLTLDIINTNSTNLSKVELYTRKWR